MIASTRVVDIRLNSLVTSQSDLAELQRELTTKIRRARSVDYEDRKRDKTNTPQVIVFVLDRRVNWTAVPELLEGALHQLRSASSHRRNPNSSQWLLFTEDSIFRTEELYNPPHTSTRFTQTEIISSARKADMEGILNDEAVFFHHNRQAFFRLPSGEISDYFLRVGNTQRDPKNIEKIAFWALPELSDVHHVLCETWSISTTAATMAQFVEGYRGTSGITWSYLSAYLPQHTSDIAHVNELFSRAATKVGKLLFLVSASASGRIHKEFLKLAHQAGAIDKIRLLTIYQLNRSPCDGIVLHPLADFLDELGLKGSTSHLDVAASPVIEIDTSTYIPKYRGITTRPFSVIKQTSRGKEFFEKYSGNSIFSIARKGRTSDRSPGRHYTYHIDVSKLMQHPAFEAKLEEIIKSSSPTTVIIYTPSATNLQFLKIFCSVHERVHGSAPEEVYELPRLSLISEMNDILSALIDEDAHVTFLESLLVEGANLNDLTQTIREVRDKGYPSKAQITYLSGLFRPYSSVKERWVNFFPMCSDHAGFKERTKITAVETVILPKWNDKDCPWQRELDAHEHALEESDLDDRQRSYIQARILLLTDAMKAGGNGLRGEEVFFKRNPRDNFPFWAGSFWLDQSAVVARNREFGVTISVDDVDQADLICAVASAVHNWRCENPTSSVFRHELDFDCVINQEVTSENVGFNEPMLRAAIWRSLKPSEINVAGSNSDTAGMLATIYLDLNEANPHRVLGGEAALAYAWRLRGLLGSENAALVDWQYLLRLAENVTTQ
ncbi:hypothetical protein [Phaeobacter sp. Ax4a-4a]|uniref:hypothetical protein n=1 Tax=Phaeobacter sp. Ax4a-4a TaxID=3112437 RepID=UPI003A878DAE